MNIAIFGNTGYLGCELEEILSVRKDINIVFTVSSKRKDGKLEDAEISFFALPHQQAMEMVPKVLPLMKFGVIDLSGAYRIKNPELYPVYYGWEHQYPLLLGQAIYSLPEKNRKIIKEANLIAVPGCYETAIILGLMPLMNQGLSQVKVRVDALSGFTGAGKGAKVPKTITPYKSGRHHQHIPAIEQELGIPERIVFFPKIAPFPRGILATIHVKMSSLEVKDLYETFYNKEPFVRVKQKVDLDEVVNTNFCDIACQIIADSWIKISVAIDNLGKGGSRQAIQILNIKLGLPETEGLL